MKVFLYLFLFASLFVSESSYWKSTKAEVGNNLVANPGFEVLQEGSPTGWDDYFHLGDGSKSIDSVVTHTGSNSWKFTQNDATGYQGAYSDYIGATEGDQIDLSVWAKSQNGTEIADIGYELFDKDKVSLGNSYFVLYSQPVGATWTELSGSKIIEDIRVQYIRIRFLGPYKSQGTIWWDDFVLTQKALLPHLGCNNNGTTARCLDFGSSNENVDGIRYGLASSVEAMPPEGEINSKNILPEQSVRIYFPEFGSLKSPEMVPDKPMMLEIKYKDTVQDPAQPPSDGSYTNRPFVDSLVEYNANLVWEPVGTLGSTGNSVWRISRIPLPKTLRQSIRSRGGNFNIRIRMPKDYSELKLPIDYVSLNIVEDSQIDSFNEYLRISRKARKVEAVDASPVPDIGKPFEWFTTSVTEPIYPITKPKGTLHGPLNMFEAQSEIATSSFSIYARDDLPNVSFGTADLNGPNSQKISKDDGGFEIKKVVYDDKYWVDNETTNTYGLMADRIETFSTINLVHQQSQQFYVYIKVPSSAEGGEYTGNIDVLIDGQRQDSIPVTLRVLPIKLDNSYARNLVYSNPFYKKGYSTNKDKVFKDFREHEAEAVNGFDYTAFVKDEGTNLAVIGDNYENFSYELQYSIDQGVIKKQAFYGDMQILVSPIISTLGLTGTLWENLNNTQFKESFKAYVRRINEIAIEKGLEGVVLQVYDEPGDGVSAESKTMRIVTDRLNTLIQEEGVKTWITYNRGCNATVTCVGSECGGLTELPSLAEVTDYQVWLLADLDSENDYFPEAGYDYYTTYYSQIRNPIYNRFMHGLLAEKTGARVVANYAYGDYMGDPQNDFDSRPGSKTQFAGGYDYILAYSTWSGDMVPSTAWEGTREGIKDAKYISTLNNLINLYPHNPVATEAKLYLRSATARIQKYWIDGYVNNGGDYGFANQIVKSVSVGSDETDYGAFDTIRSDIASFITDLLDLQKDMISVSADQTPRKAGEIITYTVTYTNPSERWVTNITISDPVPAGTEYIADSASSGGVLENGAINWRLADLAPGQKFIATFSVRVL